MSVNTLDTPVQEIHYPDSDGNPMSDNTKQFRWITTIEGGLERLFDDRPDVFVAGDLLWYPVEGDNKTRAAPDAMVAFGRPKGDRGSYKQWEENDIAPQVVFEVLSPGNTPREMEGKRAFYQRYGVEEYYLYDPDHGRLAGWLRAGTELTEIIPMRGWHSPRLGIRFDLEGLDLCLYGPDGKRFVSYVEVARQADLAEQQVQAAQQQAQAARQQAQAEAAARQNAEKELTRLRALLREKGIDD